MKTVTLEQTRYEVGCTRRGRPAYRWADYYYVIVDGVKEHPPVSRAEAYARKRELEQNHYFVEMTDTFGGEANYCWVNRFIVRASSLRGAMRRVTARTGDKVRDVGCDRWDSRTACVCYFVEWIGPDEIARYQDQYSRIEVIE